MESDLRIENQVFVASDDSSAAKRPVGGESQSRNVQIGKRRAGAAIVERRERDTGLLYCLGLPKVGVKTIVDPNPGLRSPDRCRCPLLDVVEIDNFERQVVFFQQFKRRLVIIDEK